MGIVQRIEESKAAAAQLKQEEDQTALIAALEAELAEENSGEEDAPDPIVLPEPDSTEEAPAEVQPEIQAEVLPEPQTEAEPASKSKGKK